MILARTRASSANVLSSRAISAAASSRAPLTIGIRREDPGRIWERRCPLTPEAVHDLVHKEGVRVLVQDCDRRVFTVDEFRAAGAEVHDTLAPSQITVGIKETPVPEVLTSSVPSPASNASVARTHLMFSHTHKGQSYNTPLLSKFLAESGNKEGHLLPRLVDYELLTGEDTKRTVGFGWFAGVAGALESLSALAHAHLELGVASPFLYTPRPHTHPSLTSLRRALRSVGEMVTTQGTPRSLGPLILGLTGSGQVAKGVLSILEELPLAHIRVQDLPALVADPAADLHKVYLVHALPDTYFTRKDGEQYERSDYYAHPDAYKSEFNTKVAPYLSLLLNCTGWGPAYPRLMSNDQLAIALELARGVGKGRMISVGDISCDIEGGLEFLTRSSTLSEPFYTSRPAQLPAHLPGVQMMAVDILPTSLPLDASTHFSSVLQPYLSALVREYKGMEPRDDDEARLRAALARATIAQGGKLNPDHQWLQPAVDAWRSKTEVKSASASTTPSANVSKTSQLANKATNAARPVKKRVLLLGSGMVAGPTVDEICKRKDVELLVASNALADAERLCAKYSNAKASYLDMTNSSQISDLISQADIVISLLPVPFHPEIAEKCIQHRKSMVTASYISPTMAALNEKAANADVLLLNEIGLDPGIDHCSAIKLLESLRAEGKDVLSFISFCGGLPAPEDANVPLGYKFSWSPRGVLAATLNGAKFRLGQRDYDIPENDLLVSTFRDVPVPGVLRFEGIPNRDSTPYRAQYGLDPNIRTLLRGTLRYPGYSSLVQSFKDIGLLSTQPLSQPLQAWHALIARSLESKGASVRENDSASMLSAFGDRMPSERADELVDALTWLGLIPNGTGAALPSIPNGTHTPLDLLAALLAHRLRYQEGERDLVVLSHEIVAKGRTPGAQEETHTSQLVVYGDAQASAMSRTVGLPVAFAALRVLDGHVKARGVHGPTERAVWAGVLDDLESVNLGMDERVIKTQSMESKLAADYQAVA